MAGGGSVSIWLSWDINVEANDVFSVGRKSVNEMLVNDNQLLAACSDGTIKIFDLGQVGYISDPIDTIKISPKALQVFSSLEDDYILGDADG